jgi:hypothetical protein
MRSRVFVQRKATRVQFKEMFEQYSEQYLMPAGAPLTEGDRVGAFVTSSAHLGGGSQF